MTKKRAVIVGASGYTGEELVRLLSRHPGFELVAVTSRQFAGQTISSVVPGLSLLSQMRFQDLNPVQVAEKAEVVFLALPHGVAAEYAVELRKSGKIVIDLSADFRLRSAEVYQEFYQHPHAAPHLLGEAVYALPELHRAAIEKADLLAAPGCYPTSILLALAPALRAGLLDLATLSIASLSGVSGAGKKAELSLIFAEMNENMKPYGVPKHRHLSEVEQEISLLAGQSVRVSFVPHLVPLTRGMLTTITASLAKKITEPEVSALYEKQYGAEPFIRMLAKDTLPEVKRVARTNFAEIALRVDVRTNRLILMSAIDNLMKGAGGQAIQAANLRLGFPEKSGLLV